ncbi:ice-binding family protein [Pedobacter gandavensis]|uniref:ice-binding family protein n=1 Tax=Pedobacter gandavensis TaxID=2679963 RepID=UPI00247A18D7|nr:ice-binding family protein [Pedobacter gandavensis]WGQ10652.1 ice-binding family protein [Pedobacter gandavensis]
MKNNFTQIQGSNSVRKLPRYSKIYQMLFFGILTVLTSIGACKKDDFKDEIVGLCPVVVSTDPMDKAVDVPLNKVISITFNTDMDSTTINNQTLTIKQGTTAVVGKISPTANLKVFTFTPNVPLNPFVLYSGTVTTGARDVFHTAMEADYLWSFTTIPLVSLTASPAIGGVLSGAGAFALNSSVAVTAVPNAGYTFTSWTENGTVVSNSSSYQFTHTNNRNLIANFTLIPPGNFAVNLSSSPTAGGTTTGSGAYLIGTSVTVVAAANAGYTFVNWTENGSAVSASSSYQFTIIANRTLVANYKAIPATQFAVTLTSSPVAGGTTNGEGSYPSATSVTITSAANPGYTFTNWTDKTTGLPVSTSPSYTFALAGNRAFVANFALNNYTLTVTAINGTVTKTPALASYNPGALVTLTAVPNAGYLFTGWSVDATGSTNPLTISMTSNKNITASFAAIPAVGIGPGAINLGGAGDLSILTKSGISTTGVTSVTGDIGVSPAAATAITGFGLIMDTNGQSAHTPIVTGKVYASDYAAPTPANMTTAVSNMETAFTTANGLVTPAPIVGLYAGDISGRILTAGLYKWSTGVLISNAGVTLTGGPNDTWVFQIAQDLTVNNGAKITLLGGAQAKNIFWVVTGQATLGSNTDFSGIILSKTLISLNTGAKVTGRLLAQTAVTLNASTVIQP